MVGTSFGYDFKNQVFFTQPWAFKRLFGYFDTYDKMAQVPFSIECLDISFSSNRNDYHIRAWKGHYLGAAGGEVGIFGGPLGVGIAFTEKIGIQFKLLDKSGNEILNSPKKTQFWLFSSKPFKGMGKYEGGSYTLTGTIDFLGRDDLANVFGEKINDMKNEEFSVERDGNTFTFT